MEGIPPGIPSINAAQNLDAFPLTTHNTSAILDLRPNGLKSIFLFFLSENQTIRSDR